MYGDGPGLVHCIIGGCCYTDDSIRIAVPCDANGT